MIRKVPLWRYAATCTWLVRSVVLKSLSGAKERLMKGTSRSMPSDAAVRKCAAKFVLQVGEAVWCRFIFPYYMTASQQAISAFLGLNRGSDLNPGFHQSCYG